MIFVAVSFLAGCIFGAVMVGLVYYIVHRKNESRLNGAIDIAAGRLKESFADLSLNALSKTTDQMIRMASEKLSSEREISFKEMKGQKQVIETRIESLNGEIEKLTLLVNALENRRSVQIGELRTAIDSSNVQAKELYSVTNNLKETLSSKQIRGQWGERMAEDVLASSGLALGVNYLRQSVDATTGKRPDFTFLLPNKMKLNMDVKFPFENYRKYLEAGESEKNAFQGAFVKDVRNHIKAISGREYINPEENTVDCVIMFIPNERIYGFIFESDPALIDYAASVNVLICSPVTIISVLAVIRQAADNFVIERRARELQQAMGGFRKEWSNYAAGLENIGKYIDKLSEEFRKLSTTRTNQLERSLRKVEAIKDDEIEIKE